MICTMHSHSNIRVTTTLTCIKCVYMSCSYLIMGFVKDLNYMVLCYRCICFSFASKNRQQHMNQSKREQKKSK